MLQFIVALWPKTYRKKTNYGIASFPLTAKKAAPNFTPVCLCQIILHMFPVTPVFPKNTRPTPSPDHFNSFPRMHLSKTLTIAYAKTASHYYTSALLPTLLSFPLVAGRQTEFGSRPDGLGGLPSSLLWSY